jgi:hypothetical protein
MLENVSRPRMLLMETYRSKTLNRMSRLKWKMLAIPSANPRRMHITPSLLSHGQPPVHSARVPAVIQSLARPLAVSFSKSSVARYSTARVSCELGDVVRRLTIVRRCLRRL